MARNSVASAQQAARELGARLARDLESYPPDPPSLHDAVKAADDLANHQVETPLDTMVWVSLLYVALWDVSRAITGASGRHPGVQGERLAILAALADAPGGTRAAEGLGVETPSWNSVWFMRKQGLLEPTMRDAHRFRSNERALVALTITPRGRLLLAVTRAADQLTQVAGRLTDAYLGELGLSPAKVSQVMVSPLNRSTHASRLPLQRWMYDYRDNHPDEALTKPSRSFKDPEEFERLLALCVEWAEAENQHDPSTRWPPHRSVEWKGEPIGEFWRQVVMWKRATGLPPLHQLLATAAFPRIINAPAEDTRPGGPLHREHAAWMAERRKAKR